MRFQMSKEMKNYFDNIMNSGGAYGADDRKKFIIFDVYYYCALVGMAAVELDENKSNLDEGFVQEYPTSYKESKVQIAGLLVATEAKRMGIDMHSERLEEIMLEYLDDSEKTMLSEKGITTLNAYSLRGAQILCDNMVDKPNSREEFLMTFNNVIKNYIK